MANVIKQLFTNDKADELIAAISATDKIDKKQDIADAGKALIVGADGNVAPRTIEASIVTVETGVTLSTRLGKNVRVDATQTFTTTEQARARSNINGASQSDVTTLSNNLNSLGLSVSDGELCLTYTI